MRDKGEFLFTSESVSEGHPDKVADRLSDTVLDAFLAADPYARVACETLVTTQRVVLAGIRRAYEPATLVGRQVILVANLKPRKMRFGTSEGMLLAAGDEAGVFLVAPDSGARAGMRVR